MDAAKQQAYWKENLTYIVVLLAIWFFVSFFCGIMVVDQLVVAGTVNQVVEELLEFREEVGDFGTLLYCGMDWVDERLARRSMELMAEKVLPKINAAIRGARAAA